MAVITNLIQDVVEINAHVFARTNRSIEFDDFVQEGLLTMLNDKVKTDQCKSYYSRIAKNAMLSYIKKEKNKGIVTYNHGGDRKSGGFKDQKNVTSNIGFVSLDALNTDFPEEPLSWGKKTSIPDYDNVDYDNWQSESDAIMEHWLKGREI